MYRKYLLFILLSWRQKKKQIATCVGYHNLLYNYWDNILSFLEFEILIEILR